MWRGLEADLRSGYRSGRTVHSPHHLKPCYLRCCSQWFISVVKQVSHCLVATLVTCWWNQKSVISLHKGARRIFFYNENVTKDQKPILLLVVQSDFFDSMMKRFNRAYIETFCLWAFKIKEVENCIGLLFQEQPYLFRYCDTLCERSPYAYFIHQLSNLCFVLI